MGAYLGSHIQSSLELDPSPYIGWVEASSGSWLMISMLHVKDKISWVNVDGLDGEMGSWYIHILPSHWRDDNHIMGWILHPKINSEREYCEILVTSTTKKDEERSYILCQESDTQREGSNIYLMATTSVRWCRTLVRRLMISIVALVICPNG